MPHGDYIQCPTEIIFNVPQISQIYTDLILYPEKNLCKSVKSVGLKNNPWANACSNLRRGDARA